ncbi:MAG: polyribonucleotide nucleotidyltransferase [Gemmatimonadales bacterium]|nr:polyribonucleotide nucleotidyltransferase [Gemmatimonadales bacterium]NIN11674.1 polyribonucleotide nucleotidyltransferase [Gemmatimonadales bacterium]NIN50280.1 polyribonucleotide nucleotidyltransferase [Gemmatimonadales bacterium]NIP07744.1 polyribonucleotide nucleotidyltransferase [Gemmatimonadales bacterium]NIQ99147.1 polyribonucleotide nucleotidyltransferase [Gemmatimonadales bacterium]
MQHVERPFAGRKVRVETGRLAKQAAGSAVVQFGDTMVLAAITVADSESSLPFFPLTVEYREKSYAAGKIPGGFFKREGRPGEEEILAGRLIDRSIRPLFPQGFQHEVQVFVYVLSADQENDADVLGITAASLALSLSRVPWEGPIAGVRVGRLDGQWILNPTFQELELSDVDMVVSGDADSITMVEGGALEVTEEEIADGLAVAQEGIATLVAMLKEVTAEVGAPNMEWTRSEPPAEVTDQVREAAGDRVKEALTIAEKTERVQALASVRSDILDRFSEEFPDHIEGIKLVLDEIEATTMREQVLDRGERVDGRDLDTVRSITCDVGLLPRVHGSALFTRGQTQALVSTTLGTVSDEQRIENIDVAQETTKSFMLHYNFPPFSVGEVRPVRGVSRREIGHGSLAERALQALLPPYDEFPYTIRLVSDILESNGSSSMATVCGGSLALMDAGVPMKAACAGVAMGLIRENDRVAVLTDILGTEDHLGDMDFKIAGTRDGVTAVQMDIKVKGLDLTIIRQALVKARQARLHILDVMAQTMERPRGTLSKYAPRIITIQINPERIGDIIGPKGKVIRGIQEETGAEINVDDSGLVTISSVDGDAGERAREMVESIVEEPEVGAVYEGTVKSTTAFGAFVEILPGREGLLHISELQHEHTRRTEDVVNKGDKVRVKLLEIDDRGKMRLSRKALLEKTSPAGR